MRIKCKIAAARFQWMSRFPVLEEEAEREMRNEDGSFSESKARAVLSRIPFEGEASPIDFSSDDNETSIAFAVEFLSQMRKISERLDKDDKSDVHLESRETTVDRRINERMESGDILGIFFDFDCYHGCIRCRIRIKGKKLDLKKNRDYQKYKSALEFAVFAARVLRFIKRQIDAKKGKICVILGEIGEHGIIKRAEEADAAEVAEDELRRRLEGRAMCPRRSASGYCTPICPDCEFGCYKNGKCIEPKN